MVTASYPYSTGGSTISTPAVPPPAAGALYPVRHIPSERSAPWAVSKFSVPLVGKDAGISTPITEVATSNMSSFGVYTIAFMFVLVLAPTFSRFAVWLLVVPIVSPFPNKCTTDLVLPPDLSMTSGGIASYPHLFTMGTTRVPTAPPPVAWAFFAFSIFNDPSFSYPDAKFAERRVNLPTCVLTARP